MLRNVEQPKYKKPVMVMVHGSGSSAAVFGIQTHLLAKELSQKFDLVFLDAPTPSAPGPGVLPFFADMPGYYRWLAPELSASLRLAELLDVARYIHTQLDSQNIKPSEVVAFLGFSQGALVALAILGPRLVEQSVWENLRFSVAIGAGTTGSAAQMDGVENMMGMLSTMLGREDGKFPGYSVQASGLRDLCYKDGRRLANMCARDRTKTMDYRDGNVVPRQKNEVLKLVQMIMSIDEASKATSLRTESTRAPLKESMPSLLNGGDITEGLAVLAANGIELQA
jgi:pimeloyl-ACP methyl ester carboxylesterase